MAAATAAATGTWSTDWNDCLTDAVVKLPAGTCFRAYADEGYGGARVFAFSNRAADPGVETKVKHFPTANGSLNNAILSARLYSCWGGGGGGGEGAGGRRGGRGRGGEGGGGGGVDDDADH